MLAPTVTRPDAPVRGRSVRPGTRAAAALLASAVALAATGCGGERPGGGDGATLAVQVEVLDVIELVESGDERVRVVTEHPEFPLRTVPPRLDPADQLELEVEDWDRIIHAQPESAFEVRLGALGAGSRLRVRTMVYSAFRKDPGRADPWPATFRVLVDGEERARLSTAYIREPAPHVYDQLMRTLEVDLSDRAGGPVVLRFETTREGAPRPAGEVVEANPLWFQIELFQQVEVPRQRVSPARPHLLVLNVDTLAARHTSLHGYGRPTTPHLAALAERGAVFDAAVSPSSWTLPATASLLTGLPPNTHGVLGDARSYLLDGLATLPELLRQAGIEGAAFVANALVAEGNNFDQGFGTWVQANDATAEVLNARLLEWIDAQPRDHRWFAYVHYFDPHAPYGAPGEHRERFTDGYVERRDVFGGHLPNLLQTDRIEPLADDEQRHVANLYDGEVAYFDRCLGELLAALAARGLDDRTTIVVTSDHGEELFEHGALGHGYTLYDELLHVPLVMAGPRVPAGARIAAPVGTEALFNTLLRLGDLPELHGAAPSLPIVAAAPGSGGDLYATSRTHLFGPARTLIAGRDAQGRKAIGALPGDGGDPTWSFHDLRDDPGEQRPLELAALPAAEREAFAALRDRTLRWHAETARRRPPEPQEPNPELEEALIQVGYLHATDAAGDGNDGKGGDDGDKRSGDGGAPTQADHAAGQDEPRGATGAGGAGAGGDR